MANLTTLVTISGGTSGPLILDANGDLFGTTEAGGANSDGSVFEIPYTASGYATSPTTLASFTQTNGYNPDAGLIEDADGNLFGTTFYSGTGNGTVFELAKTPSGYATTPTILATFNGSDGAFPDAVLIADANGDLFGTTSAGGANGDGTVFEIANTASGYAATPVVLTSLTGTHDSSKGGLLADANGNLFGTTVGGDYEEGTVFALAKTATGYATTPTVLASFTSPNGSEAGLIIGDANGDLFGTAFSGGTNGAGSVFEIKNTPNGYATTLTTLVSFGGADGSLVGSGLISDAKGDLFGTTVLGGANGDGTVFEIANTASGYASTPTTLISLTNADGRYAGTLVADASGDLFGTATATDGSGDIIVFEVTNSGYQVACYCTGTRILTSCGEVAVEDLAIGDLVVTSSGEHRPIRWLGHRTMDCRSHIRPEEAYPVRIERHAFGENKPAQDLTVSRGHWICVDVLGEVLISVNDLINGTTITQVEVDQVTYWHVELDSHDVLIANGLPAESYRNTGNRNFFVENGIVAFDVVPDADLSDPSLRTDAGICRPFIDGGPVLDAVRHQLRRRAETLGWMLDTSQTLADLHLVVDGHRIDPVVRGLTARFAMSASARDVWLVSTTVRPIDLGHSDDVRHLGVSVRELTLYDGFGDPRVIAMDDPLLCTGFYGVEEGCRQWTARRARLPAALWARCSDEFFLRIQLDGPALPRWTKLPAGAQTSTAAGTVGMTG